MIPTTTSFIFTSSYLHNITNEHQALYEAANPQAISYRIKGHKQGCRDFSGFYHVDTKHKEVPANKDEKTHAYQPSNYVESISKAIWKHVDQEIYKDMPPVPGCNRDAEPYDNSTPEAYQLKSPDNGPRKKPQKDIAHSEQHNECERSTCNCMHPIA